jgi:hypothetical protein
VVIPTGGGDDGPAWDGKISVIPDHLDAAAPGFSGASDQVGTASETVSTWADGSLVGISNPQAAQAWGRMCDAWSTDLGNLSYAIYQVAAKLPQTAQGYRDGDAGAASPYQPH